MIIALMHPEYWIKYNAQFLTLLGMIEIIISMLIGKAIYMKGMKETIVPKIL